MLTESCRQKYSLYLPLHPKARKAAAAAKHEEKVKKEREAARNQRTHYWEEQVNMSLTCLLR